MAAVATALIPVATSSGEALEEHVGDPGAHAELGDQLIWFALPLLILSTVLVWLDRQRLHPASDASAETVEGRSPVIRTVAALALVAAVAASVQVYRVGDSGARAAWGDQTESAG